MIYSDLFHKKKFFQKHFPVSERTLIVSLKSCLKKKGKTVFKKKNEKKKIRQRRLFYFLSKSPPCISLSSFHFGQLPPNNWHPCPAAPFWPKKNPIMPYGANLSSYPRHTGPERNLQTHH
jgi:hypothetical protein